LTSTRNKWSIQDYKKEEDLLQIDSIYAKAGTMAQNHQLSSSVILATISLFLILAEPLHCSPMPDDLVDVVNTVDRSLVQITIDDSGTFGSGFLYRDRHTVITNRHVVEELDINSTLSVRPIVKKDRGLADLGPPVTGVVRFMHPRFDLAVIELVDPIVKSIPLVSADQKGFAPRGLAVMVHGFPDTISPTVSRGIVAGHHYSFLDDTTYYLLDAAISDGSSGGAVTDSNGKLLGVATAASIVEIGFSWTWAIPISIVDDIFIGNKGVSSIPKVKTVQQLAQQLQDATDAKGNTIVTLGIILNEIANTRATQKVLVADSHEFIKLGLALVTVKTKQDMKLLSDTLLRAEIHRFNRFSNMGIRGDESISDWSTVISDDLWEATSWIGAIQSVLTSKKSTDRLSWHSFALLPLADALDQSAEIKELTIACEKIKAWDSADKLEFKEIDREEYIAINSILRSVSYLLDLSLFQGLPPEEQLDGASTETAMNISKFESAIINALEIWKQLPVECRGETDTAEDVRNDLFQQGYRIISNRIEDISIPANTFEERYMKVEEYSRERAIAVLAESKDGADIDIFILDPDGNVAWSDEAEDAFPYAEIDCSIMGKWTIRIFNNSNSKTSALLEIWSLE
jgi:S1-C subfamily serine protease